MAVPLDRRLAREARAAATAGADGVRLAAVADDLRTWEVRLAAGLSVVVSPGQCECERSSERVCVIEGDRARACGLEGVVGSARLSIP